MAPFFRSSEEFGEVKVNGAVATGGSDATHSSRPHLPIRSLLPWVKHRVESKRRDPCVPKSPQHRLSLDHIPSDSSSGLGGS